MIAKTYLRPILPLNQTAAHHECSEVDIRVAGRTDLRAASAEVIRRRTQAGPRDGLQCLGADDLRARARSEADLAALLKSHEAPRASLAGRPLSRPLIMGIINTTPDSFSDGGTLGSVQAAIERAHELVDAGADILDIGGESTRPGAEPVPTDEELRRVLPVIQGLAGRTSALISVDTRKAEVMRQAVAAGAHIINDVAALSYEPGCLEVAASCNAPIVLMHAQGDPRTMQAAPHYDHCLLDVYDWLQTRISACEAAGIARERLLIDPGIGFGKTLAHNLELLHGLSLFHGLGLPLLLGASRKSFVGTLSGVKNARERTPGSLAAALHGAAQGAQILRVHDVAETRQALDIWAAIVSGRAP